MIDKSVHPTYQHRHVDDDGLCMIVSEDQLGGLVRNGRTLLFGYWRPHVFTQLASLVMKDEGAVLQGIQGERGVHASRFDGDPDVLVSEWLSHAKAARKMDMDDREAAILRREVRDTMYKTRQMSGPFDKGAVSEDPLSIRWALQVKGDLINGTWVGSTLVREVASLTWEEDKSVLLTAGDRKLSFQAPVDLDALVGTWLAFVSSAREDMEYQDALSEVRRTIGQGADQAVGATA